MHVCVRLNFYAFSSHTIIYTLSLHDALPISTWLAYNRRVDIVLLPTNAESARFYPQQAPDSALVGSKTIDRKSTRLNSSHGYISYAVFCLKKKKKDTKQVY